MLNKIEFFLIWVFDQLPEKLDKRVEYCLLICYPIIICKAIKRIFFSREKKRHLNRAFQKYYYEVKERFNLSKIPANIFDEEICVRFSGGTDSTLTATTMAYKFNRIHLLTFITTYKKRIFNPFGIISSNPESVLINLDNLKNKFGKQKFIHSFLKFDDLRNEIYFRDYIPNFSTRDFKQVSFCPSCSLAMHIKTIIYCLEHNIKYITDGSNIENGVFPWQTQNPYNLEEIMAFYKIFNLDYIINPNYFNLTSDYELYKLGITKIKNTKKNYYYRRKTQQYCILIQFQSLCRRLHGKVENYPSSPCLYDEGMISKYFKSKIPFYKEYIYSRT
ncbi:MAG: hypothetical protein ACMUJM_22475 [bacterium]